MTTTSPTSVSPSVDVDAPVAHALDVCTAGIGTWSDEDTHLARAAGTGPRQAIGRRPP